MVRKLLLLRLILGVAAVAGANEASAVAVLDPAPPVAQTVADPQFARVDFKRGSLHRGFGGVRKSFRGPRFFAGKRFRPDGVFVGKRFVGPRFFPGKRLSEGGVIVRNRAVGPQPFLGKRFGDGGLIARKRVISPQLFLGKRFGDGGVVVRKGFAGPRLLLGERFGEGGVVVRNGFVGKRFGHRPFFSDRHLHRFHR